MTSNGRITAGFVGVGMLTGLLAGCDESIAPEPMTEEDAIAVAALIGGVSAGPLYDEGVAVAAGAQETFDLEAECPAGGSVKLSGTIDGDDSATKIDATATYGRCDDGRIAVSGSVDELHHLRHDVSDGTVHLAGHVDWTGSVDWAKADGSRGSCEVDVRLEATAEVNIETGIWENVDGGMSGTVCGVSVEGEVGDWWLDAL